MIVPAIIVFARQPVAGATKTRLIPALGAAGAARLYAQLLARTLNEVARVAEAAWYLYADESAAVPYFEARLPPQGAWQVAAQTGDTLGARMANALDATLARHPQVILIGSDIIDFTAADLRAALRALANDVDTVLAPAADGGYWLVGLRRPRPALFEGIEWGAADVYEKSAAKLVAEGLRWQSLPVCHDIDTPPDLTAFAAELSALSARPALIAGEFRTELFDPAGLGSAQLDEPRA